MESSPYKRTSIHKYRRMMELESHHIATTIVTMVSVKNHPWVVRLVGDNLKKNTIFPVSKVSPTSCLLMTKEKIELHSRLS